MTRQLVLPHLQAEPGSVTCGPWLIGPLDEAVELGPQVTDWAYDVDLQLGCTVDIDTTGVRSSCGLTEEDPLDLVVVAEASSTGTRQRAWISTLPSTDEASFCIDFVLSGERIGGDLALERLLLLGGTGSAENALAAKRAGSILWREGRKDRTVTALEGDASRFPTIMADFAGLPIAEPDAAWYLQLSFADLNVTPLAAIQLFVNSRHPVMRRVVEGQTDEVTKAGLSVLEWDVARTMIRSALTEDDFVDGWDSFPADTFGEALQLLIARYWPGTDAESLRALMDERPERFEYTLQARLHLLEGL